MVVSVELGYHQKVQGPRSRIKPHRCIWTYQQQVLECELPLTGQMQPELQNPKDVIKYCVLQRIPPVPICGTYFRTKSSKIFLMERPCQTHLLQQVLLQVVSRAVALVVV